MVSSPHRRKRRKDRPVCSALTRAGGLCRVRVEPGKVRCQSPSALAVLRLINSSNVVGRSIGKSVALAPIAEAESFCCSVKSPPDRAIRLVTFITVRRRHLYGTDSI